MRQLSDGGALELCGSERRGADLYDRWLTFLAQYAQGYRVEKQSLQASNFHLRAHSRTLDHFTLVHIVSSVGRYRLLRDTERIASDGQDRYGLCLSMQGDFEIRQFRREQQVGCGAYTFVCGSEPGSLSANAQGGVNDTIALFVPREFVDQRIVGAEDLCARAYRPGSGLHTLVSETVMAFDKSAWTITDDEFRKAVRVIADLVLLAISGSVDPLCGERSVRAGNLARAKNIMRRRLGDSDLTLGHVADECGLSLDYLHKLFRDEGRTMWEYLKGERLRRARELLEVAATRHLTITEVALECGFSNMSYFSTAFKLTFGLSPRDVVQRTQASKANAVAACH